jgi:DNA-binding CsgD family transcriptional regulator
VFAWDCLEAHRALGLAALFEGDFGTAVTHFGRVWQHCRRERVEDPGAFPVAGDLVEGLVATGDLAQAEAVTDLLGTASKAQRHPWGLATTSRAQGLIAFARDDFGPSLELLGSAASRYQALGLDFESARCLLWLGQLHRRTQRRSEARKALQGAVDLFSTLGCEGWASKARAESSGVSGRRAVGADQLTSREEQVVTLAVQGLSNKEIAKALFVSVYTVEDHLSHAYAKLGVRSRSQLASRLDGR